MHYTPALLLSLLQLCTVAKAAPLSVEVVKMKSKVKWMAEQLVVKINNNFQQIPTTLTTSLPSEEQYGPSSIVTILDGYNNLISDSFNGAPQVKFEIAALTGFIDQWRQGHCSERPKPPVPERLQDLQSRKQYIHSVSFSALFRVKEYLRNLLKNLDQLDTCT